MGGGPTNKDEVRRRAPVPLLAGGPAEVGGDGGSAALPDFCELTQEARFRATDPSAVAIGGRIRLLAQQLPVVLAGSASIGVVLEPNATAIRGCLLAGFEMAGSVKSFDSATQEGTLVVSGVRTGG